MRGNIEHGRSEPLGSKEGLCRSKEYVRPGKGAVMKSEQRAGFQSGSPMQANDQNDGARRLDPQNFRRNAESLYGALRTESDPFMAVNISVLLGTELPRLG